VDKVKVFLLVIHSVSTIYTQRVHSFLPLAGFSSKVYSKVITSYNKLII